jgi:hypothetical protein
MIEFDLEFRCETKLAVLVAEGDGMCWLPKSQVQYDEGEYTRGDVVTIYIPRWLAKEKELI